PTTCASSSHASGETTPRRAGQRRQPPDQEESDPGVTISNRRLHPRQTTARACPVRALQRTPPGVIARSHAKTHFPLASRTASRASEALPTGSSSTKSIEKAVFTGIL